MRTRRPSGMGIDFDFMSVLKSAGGSAAAQVLNIPEVKSAVSDAAEKSAYEKAAQEVQDLRKSATEFAAKNQTYLMIGGVALAGLAAYLIFRKK